MTIVLVNPEIPQNTGTIARLCAVTNTTLELVHPLGFKIDDKHLRRAGLDYWKSVDVCEIKSIDEFKVLLWTYLYSPVVKDEFNFDGNDFDLYFN